MKKITLLTLTLLMSVVMFAQKSVNAEQTQVFTGPELVKGLDTMTPMLNVEPEAYTSPWSMRRAASDYNIITEQPEGTLKVYTRSGSYINGSGYIYSQTGFAEVVFAEDGETVYLKDPYCNYRFNNWAKGTISGNTITLPLGQVIGYYASYDAPVLLGLSYPSIVIDGNITYTIDNEAGTITLDTYTDYQIGTVGTVLNVSGNFYRMNGYGEYATVFTYFEEPDVVTPPAGVVDAAVEYPYTASMNASTAYSSTVKVGWDGADVYVQGFCPYLPEAWAKGTLDAETNIVTFDIQYFGKDSTSPYFLTGYSGGNVATFKMDYDEEEKTFSANGSMMITTSATEMSYVAFFNGGFIGTPPEAKTLPSGVTPTTYPLYGSYTDGSKDGEGKTVWTSTGLTTTVQIGVDGEDTYWIGGLAIDVDNDWVTGKMVDGKLVIPTGQYVGKNKTYGSNVYLVGYVEDEEHPEGAISDIVFAFDAEAQTYTLENFLFVNGKKSRLSYNYYYSPTLTIGGPMAIDVVVAPESGSITEAINTALGEQNFAKTVTVNLTDGANYTLEEPIESLRGVTINGNGATIDATNCKTGEGDEAKAAPLVQMSSLLDPTIKNGSGYYQVDGGITFNDVTIKNVKGSIISDNGQQYSLHTATLNNVMIELNTEASVNAIDFSKGGIKELYVMNSTVYQTSETNNVKYFVQYLNGARYDRLGYEDGTIIYYMNNTFYHVASDNWANYSGISNKTLYVIQKNIFVDCSKNGDIARRMLGNGRLGTDAEADFGLNTYWFKGEALSQGNYDKTDVLVSNPYIKCDWATSNDITDENRFAIDAESAQALNYTGDQRWGTWAPEKYNIFVSEESLEHSQIVVPASAMAEDIVKFQITPDQGYGISKVTAKVGSTPIKVTEVDAQNHIYSIIMPPMDVKLEAAIDIVSTEFVIDVNEPGNINDAIKAATEGLDVKGMTINLNAAGVYPVTETIVSPGKLVINGVDGAIIDASACVATTGEGEGAVTTSAPLLALSTTPAVGFAPKYDGSGDTDYYLVSLVQVKNVKVTGLKNSIFYDNNTKYCVANFTIDNCVFELATEAVENEALISFKAGGAKDFAVKNSTFMGNNAVAKYFIRYNNSARLDRYGYDVSETSIQFMNMTYTNNTFYGLLIADGQWGNYNGVQGYARAKFDIQKNIWYNCGKDIIRRLAGGRFNDNAPRLFAYNTYFNNDKSTAESEAKYDNSETILKYNPYFEAAAEGKFALGASTEQAFNETGDKRWGTWENQVYTITITEMEGGTIEAPATAMADDEIQLVAKPAEGYRLKAGSVKGKMGKSEFEISEDLTFFMPVANVTISAEFELIPTFAITIAEGIENGTVVADKQEAAEGDVITLTITPAEGFELDYITVTGVNSDITVPVENNKFTMPADAVTINAAFKATATGINAIAVDKLDNAVIYNLQGVRVEKSQAKGGVFIVNGKKTFLK